MATIIAGHFDHVEHLNEAIRLLEGQGFGPGDYASFYLNPPGQHGLYMLGGDAAADQGSDGAGKGAAAGAAIGGGVGMVVGAIGGPIGALAGSGVGAYLGALAGALSQTTDPEPAAATKDVPAEPPGGPMLAIHVDQPGQEATAIAILGHSMARQIDRANGTWTDGTWTDFDPREPVVTLLKRQP
ncbi:hypothetical protein [Azoarcus olearius]|uniref:Glycine zipper domain-containing protein n=1 Tax=Azoarcus sp. (strain BH72) TaxID=418699 RepID=A1K6F1_AZOSB|nr:hypothetical protein [Azoarcus olearius]CAL94406.1 conserved hypothetical protein [Azoarcus olearius]